MKKRVLVALLCISMGISSQIGVPVAAAAPMEAGQLQEEVFLDEKGAKASEIKLSVKSGSDISVKLKEAIKEAEGNSGTTTITIPSGSYRLGEQIRLKSNINIVATGATITASGSIDSMVRAGETDRIKNASIEGGTWNCNKKTKFGFVFGAAKNITVKDCKVMNSNGHGLRVAGKSSGVSVDGCTFSGCGQSGIYVDASAVSSISKTVISGNKTTGITVTGGSTLSSLTSTKIHSNESHGLASYKKSKVSNVSGCTIEANKEHGITVSEAALEMNDSKGDNTVKDNNWNGVSITGKTSKVTIKGGNFSHNGRKPKVSSEGESGHGVGVFSGASLELTDATMENNSVCGVSPFGAGTSATIQNCVIQNNGRHGIGGRKSVTLRIKGNLIKNNKNHGIMVNDRCDAKYIENNTISGSQQCGISVGVNSKAMIKNNKILKSKQQGIYVYEKSQATISGGSIQTSKDCGIVTYENANVTIKKVTISKCSNYGMNIKGGKANIQSCNVNNNKNSGIQVKLGAKSVVLSNNKINKNGNYGIYCNGSAISKLQKNTVTNHNKYGIVLYDNTTCNGIKNNTLSNPAGVKEISVQNSKANVGDANPLEISSAKKNSSKITGKAAPKSKVSVKIGGKTYSATANASGNYTINTSKLKKGTKLKVQADIGSGNKIYIEKVI